MRLDPLPQGMDGMAHGVATRDACVGPQGLDDLIDMGRPASLADQVLEQLAGPLHEPVTLDGDLLCLDPGLPERVNPKARLGHPMGLCATASIADSRRA